MEKCPAHMSGNELTVVYGESLCVETKGPEGQGGPHNEFCDNTPESTSSHVKQGVSNYYS